MWLFCHVLLYAAWSIHAAKEGRKSIIRRKKIQGCIFTMKILNALFIVLIHTRININVHVIIFMYKQFSGPYKFQQGRPYTLCSCSFLHVLLSAVTFSCEFCWYEIQISYFSSIKLKFLSLSRLCQTSS